MADSWEAFLGTIDPVALAREWTTASLVEARAEGFQRVRHKRMVRDRRLRLAKERQQAHSKRARDRLWALVDDMNDTTPDKQAMRSAAVVRKEKKIAQARFDALAEQWIKDRKKVA